MIAQQRRKRLVDAMADAGLDVLLVYGNAWQGDYLRYATDFGILEGQALALVRNDGHVTLYLDSPLEADRAALDCPGAEIVLAPDLVCEVDRALDRMRNQRMGAAPQRLLPRQEGKGRIAAVEILLNTPLVSDMIFKGEVGDIKELMKRSRELGMQTFDQALFDLYEARHVSYEDALRNADSVNDLRLQIKLNSQRARNADLSAGTEHLTIV